MILHVNRVRLPPPVGENTGHSKRIKKLFGYFRKRNMISSVMNFIFISLQQLNSLSSNMKKEITYKNTSQNNLSFLDNALH